MLAPKEAKEKGNHARAYETVAGVGLAMVAVGVFS
jgi:hypothetical protein